MTSGIEKIGTVTCFEDYMNEEGYLVKVHGDDGFVEQVKYLTIKT